MASFSISSPSLIPLSLYILLSAVSTNSYPIDNICKQTKNPGFCKDILNPHSSKSLQEIEQIVIESTLSNVRPTYARIKSDLPKQTDQNLIVIYSLCSNYYGAASDVLTVALEEARARDFSNMDSASEIVAEDVTSCLKTFSMAPSLSIPFASETDTFDLLSNIFVVATKLLLA